jgi:hypothetical protein
MRNLADDATAAGTALWWSWRALGKDGDTSPAVSGADIRTRSADLNRAGGAPTSWRTLVDRYCEGWAEADPFKVIQATEPGYRFEDPLVGLFTRWSLPQYFELLQARFAAAGAVMPRDFAFVLRGPLAGSSSRLGLKVWREAPRLGLSGIGEVKVGHRGVMAERVSYDLNLASGVLRREAVVAGRTTAIDDAGAAVRRCRTM